MAVPSTVDQFLELTVKSGLLDPERLAPYREQLRAGGPLSGAPRALANALVRDGLLTRFQAERLLLGRWRHFLLCGKYKVLGPLGSGGMGDVYLCEHLVMRRRVAVKVLPTARSGNPAYLERFHREARAVARVRHPNIVSGHDVDHDGNIHFLVMEHVDGNTLHKIVRERGPMGPARAAHYVRQAALGLQHAHEQGLVHRDVKPSNLLLDRTGTVKILDLGLARFFHDEADDLSRLNAGGPLGTREYMAPEQALDSHAADVRADVYSLGATFYFLLTGQNPFREGAAAEQTAGHPSRRPRPLRELRPEVPEGLAALVERMMARDPAQRSQTPTEVVEALAPWVQVPIPPPPPEEMPELLPDGRGPKSTDVGRPAAASGSASESALSPFPLETSLPPSTDSRPSSSPTLVQPAAPSPTPPPGEPRPDAASAPQPPPAAGPRRRGVAIAAALLLVVAVAVALALYLRGTGKGPPGGGAGGPPRLRLLVPAYFYPAGDGLAEWYRLLDAPADAAVVVIANPASGPGKAVDPNYAKVLERARHKGVRVIGYVSTKYAARPLPEVQQDVDRWVSFYPGVEGIFFDEQASGPDKVLYYTALHDYVRKDRGLSLVIGNPGTVCAEDYLARPAVDVACLVETTKDLGAYRPPAWAARYPADRFAALVRQTHTPGQMRAFLASLEGGHIGYCYVTDGEGANPWGRLPRYWEEEVAAVRRVNAGQAP